MKRDELLLKRMKHDRGLDFAINFPETVKASLEGKILDGNYRTYYEKEAEVKKKEVEKEELKQEIME